MTPDTASILVAMGLRWAALLFRKRSRAPLQAQSSA
jgi:hypothetical protein